MLLQILSQTPKRVFLLFAALLWLGCSQLRTRDVRSGRMFGIAIAMIVFSLCGTLAASRHVLAFSLGAWFAGAALVAAATMLRPLPPGTRYDAVRSSFTVAGSALPLALMMTMFFTKYGVAVALARNPQLAFEPGFVLGAAALYGVGSGAFGARAARLWRLAHRSTPAVACGLAVAGTRS